MRKTYILKQFFFEQLIDLEHGKTSCSALALIRFPLHCFLKQRVFPSELWAAPEKPYEYAK